MPESGDARSVFPAFAGGRGGGGGGGGVRGSCRSLRTHDLINDCQWWIVALAVCMYVALHVPVRSWADRGFTFLLLLLSVCLYYLSAYCRIHSVMSGKMCTYATDQALVTLADISRRSVLTGSLTDRSLKTSLEIPFQLMVKKKKKAYSSDSAVAPLPPRVVCVRAWILWVIGMFSITCVLVCVCDDPSDKSRQCSPTISDRVQQ